MKRILLCLLFVAGATVVLANIAAGFVAPAAAEWGEVPRAELPDKSETDQAKTESGLDAFLQKPTLNIDYVKREMIKTEPKNGDNPIPKHAIDTSIQDRLKLVYHYYDAQDPEKCEAMIYENDSSGTTSNSNGPPPGMVPSFVHPGFNPGQPSQNNNNRRQSTKSNAGGQQKKYKIDANSDMIGTEWRVTKFLPDGLLIEHVGGKVSFVLLKFKKVELPEVEPEHNP